MESPLTPGYAGRYGVASFKTPEFIESGTLIPDSPFITRPAPGLGDNLGGGIEVVTPSNSVILDSFSMPDWDLDLWEWGL